MKQILALSKFIEIVRIKRHNSIDQNTLTWAVANIFPKKLKPSILRNFKWQYSCKISEKFNQQILTQSETCQLCTHKCSQSDSLGIINVLKSIFFLNKNHSYFLLNDCRHHITVWENLMNRFYEIVALLGYKNTTFTFF